MTDETSVTNARAGKPKAMILSVGGSPAPVVASLNAQRPELVCFFVSVESRPSLNAQIMPALAYHPTVHDLIETPSAEDLLACYRALVRGLPALAEKWKVPLSEFAADYTGGTKTMSVALGLATIQVVGRYTYVGGTERTKDGLGVVVDGKEKMLYQANPWEELAVSARQRARLLFGRGRYEAAAEEFEGVVDRASPADRSVYGGLATLARGYAEWDRFAHRRAQELFSKSLRTLEPFAAGSEKQTWSELVGRVRDHVGFLRELERAGDGPCHVADLIANARRRGNLEGRYDDAVARLYSALEMSARVALQGRHGIRASSASPDQIPVSLREEFCHQYGVVRKDGTRYLKLPHYAAFRLLAELEDELAARYFAREKDVKALLDLRNASILAHGDRPVGEEVFRRFLPVVCEVTGVRDADLPQFPELPA